MPNGNVMTNTTRVTLIIEDPHDVKFLEKANMRPPYPGYYEFPVSEWRRVIDHLRASESNWGGDDADKVANKIRKCLSVLDDDHNWDGEWVQDQIDMDPLHMWPFELCDEFGKEQEAELYLQKTHTDPEDLDDEQEN